MAADRNAIRLSKIILGGWFFLLIMSLVWDYGRESLFYFSTFTLPALFLSAVLYAAGVIARAQREAAGVMAEALQNRPTPPALVHLADPQVQAVGLGGTEHPNGTAYRPEREGGRPGHFEHPHAVADSRSATSVAPSGHAGPSTSAWASEGPTAEAAATSRCPTCGKPVGAGFRFCLFCKQELVWE